MNESLISHKINNHISYVTTLKEGIYINYRENQDKNYKTRLCLKTKRLTNVFEHGQVRPSGDEVKGSLYFPVFNKAIYFSLKVNAINLLYRFDIWQWICHFIRKQSKFSDEQPSRL